MAKVKLSLGRLSIPQKITRGQNIISAMTGNANFPSANPTLPALQTLVTNLTNTNNAFEAGKVIQDGKKTARDAAEAAFDAGFTTEAATVQSASLGDATKILSSGMQVAGTPGAVVPPSQVLNLVLTAGDNDGTLDFAFDPDDVAKSYEVETSVDPGLADELGKEADGGQIQRHNHRLDQRRADVGARPRHRRRPPTRPLERSGSEDGAVSKLICSAMSWW